MRGIRQSIHSSAIVSCTMTLCYMYTWVCTSIRKVFLFIFETNNGTNSNCRWHFIIPLNLPSTSPEMKVSRGQLNSCPLTLLILVPWSGAHNGRDMLLPMMQGMTTSMSLLISDRALLGYLKISTADLTISGKISTIVIELVYVYFALIR